MKMLITSATRFEIRPLMDNFTFIQNEDAPLFQCQYRDNSVDFLITGMGTTPTAYYLGKILSQTKYDYVINAGICGSYTNLLPIGKVVNVTEENFCELGAENNDQFISLFQLGLVEPDDPPFRSGKLINNTPTEGSVLKGLEPARGITSNTIHGHAETIRKMRELFKPDIESMEGAAFFYACLLSGVPFHEIRSISNFVEERDKSKWDIPLALANLNNVLFEILKEQENGGNRDS
ncbi:MAG: futalosine hydrolase [Bacteroidales bacterium]|jgi:futalosine hydrolase